MEAPVYKPTTGGAAPRLLQAGIDLEEILRELLGPADEEPTSNSPRPVAFAGQPEVVFDLCVQGVRYTLIRHAEEAPAPPPHVTLSPREQEIVRLIAKGLPNKAIAAALDISLWTVATHLRRVFSKLGVNSRAEMVARILNDQRLARSVRGS